MSDELAGWLEIVADIESEYVLNTYYEDSDEGDLTEYLKWMFNNITDKIDVLYTKWLKGNKSRKTNNHNYK
jgi:hypothetical protein